MKESVKRKIESYRKSNDKRPLVVDVSTPEELNSFNQEYATISKKDVYDLVKVGSEIPQLSDIHEYLGNCNEDIVILTGMGAYLRLMGKVHLNQIIHSIIATTYNSKFIIITYQCSKFFDEKDPRLKDKIIKSEENNLISSSIVFIDPKYKDIVKAENGLMNALRIVEKTSSETIYVTTTYSVTDFKDSLIRIEEYSSPYNLICIKDASLKRIPIDSATEEQWGKLLNKLKNNSVEKTIQEFIKYKDVLDCLENWNEMSEFEQWLLFLYLKLYNTRTSNWAVNYAIDKSKKFENFIENIYYSLINLDYKEIGFWDKYNERKRILKAINEDSIIYKYCNYIEYKNEDTLFYLTDNTENEKKLIIKIIDRYHDTFTKKKLMEILVKVYPDLYWYLYEYNYGNPFLSNYFNEYKYLKVTNVLTKEFKELVERESVNRSFNKDLMYRSEILNDLEYNGAIVYFIDALGVEYLSYIEKKCQERGLACRISICKCNLPSITEKNTEFKEFFRSKNIDVLDEKALDILKHSGKDDYDFSKTSLPIYIIEEFKIIDKCLDNIRQKIKSQTNKKAIIVSDHGATRLAILNKDLVRENVESIGEHGGRICKFVPGMKTIPNAIRVDDSYVLANYNAFKGGRIGKVEMHGGATLEEVTVPVIEIYEKDQVVYIKVITEVIKVSYKTNALLKFYSSVKLKNVIIRINGREYNSNTSDGNNFSVELEDIKKSGEYCFEVWADNELISSDNSFKIEKESAVAVDLWG